MMGKSHAKQGICAVGVAACASGLIEYAPLKEPLIVVILAALLVSGTQTPDMDSKGANATKAYGPITGLVSWVIRGISRTVYAATRTSKSPKKKGSHRALTHTLVGNILAGGLVATVASFGPIPAAVIIGGLAGIGAYALFRKYYLLIGAVVGFATYSLPGVDFEYLWLWALAFTIGNAVHCFGDSCTLSGIPYFWPLTGWKDKHFLPEQMRVTTGKAGEKVLMFFTYLLTGLTMAGLVWLNHG